MHSGNCVIAVERALQEVPGVVAARVKYPPGLAAITYQVVVDGAGYNNSFHKRGGRHSASADR